MGPPSYMRSVVDRNVGMRRISVLYMRELRNFYEQFFILCRWFCNHILRVRTEE